MIALFPHYPARIYIVSPLHGYQRTGIAEVQGIEFRPARLTDVE